MSTGYLSPSPESFKSGAAEILAPFEGAPWAGWLVADPQSGAVTRTQPVDELQQARAGSDQPMFGMADWYNRIHLTPALLDMENVIGLQTRSVVVWNAYTVPQTLTGIAKYNDEGIALDEPAATPLVYEPLRERTYTVEVGTNGPPTIEATFTFDFAPYDLVLSVIGLRVVAWPFTPDWSNGIIERLEWKTDVLQSFDASEQRGALRLAPRKTYEFDAFFEGKARRYAEAVLWGWSARTWALPIWPDGQDLAIEVALGATELPVNTTARDFSAGQLVVIISNAFAFEVVEIQSVQVDSLTLKRPTDAAWPIGARVYPARMARITDQVKLPRWDGRASGARVVFNVEGGVDYAASAGATTYRGKPVLTAKPSWTGGFDLEMVRKLAELDNITGVNAYDDESGLPTTLQRMRWGATGKTEQDTFRKLLYALQGRRASLWVPTWTDDLVLAVPISIGAVSIDVEWLGYTYQIIQAVGRRDIRIELVSGQVLYRRIIGSVEVDASTERLSLDAEIAQTVQIADVVQISFMSLARLDADAVELAHWTGDFFEAATVFRSFNNDV